MLRIKNVPDKNTILYLVLERRVRRFKGVNIPGFCAVIKNTDNLHLVTGVRTITLNIPKQGAWGSNFKSWNEVKEFFNSYFSLEVIKKIIRAEFLATAKRLDQIAFESGEVSKKTIRPVSRRKRPRNVVKDAGKTLHASRARF